MFEAGVVRAVLLSLLPGFFWLSYLRSLSPRNRLPWWLWLWALTLGWLSTELTLFVSDRLGVEALQRFPVLPLLLYFVVGVGLVEEVAKAACAFLGLTVPRFATEPLATLQLSGAVALGFATAENVHYVLSFGEVVLVGRSVLSTLGHILFSALWGFALGSWSRWRLLGISLLLSGGAHGLYNWFLSTDRFVLAVITLVVLWFGFRQATLEAFLRQEYVRELPYETYACPTCKVLTRAEGSYCTFCGASLDQR